MQDIDKEESALSKELNCAIRIRDGRFIEANINSTPAIQGAFVSFLQPSISHLFNPGTADTGEETGKYSEITFY